MNSYVTESSTKAVFFCVGQVNVVFEVFLRMTPVATVIKIWDSTFNNKIIVRPMAKELDNGQTDTVLDRT